MTCDSTAHRIATTWHVPRRFTRAFNRRWKKSRQARTWTYRRLYRAFAGDLDEKLENSNPPDAPTLTDILKAVARHSYHWRGSPKNTSSTLLLLRSGVPFAIQAAKRGVRAVRSWLAGSSTHASSESTELCWRWHYRPHRGF